MHINRLLRRACAVALFCSGFAGAAAAAAPIDVDRFELRAPPVVAGALGRVGPKVPSPPASAKSAVVAGQAAAWLAGTQRADGAFPWTPGDPDVFANTQGATALGLLRAFERTGVTSQRNSAIANGNCQLAANACIPGFLYDEPSPNPPSRHRFATHDPYFLEELSRVTGDPAYADYVDAHFWSDLAAGAYGANADLDASEFANFVLSARTGQGIPELVPWDLSKLVLAADVAGETVARDAFVAASLAGLEAADAAHDTYDVVGLAGALFAAATAGVALDPEAGHFAAAENVGELAEALLAFRTPSGGFVTGSAEPLVDANGSAQTTAYAMLALHAADPALYRNEIATGFGFLLSLQQASGQFLAYPGAPLDAAGGIEGQGETLEAYAIVVLGDVYVDDSWLSLPNGNVVTVSHPLVPAGTVATIGVDAFATIGGGTAAVAPGQTVYVSAGSYNENVSIARPMSVLGADAASTILDGASLAGSGIAIASHVTNVTVEDLTVRNYTQINSSSGACIWGAESNHDTTIRRTIVHDCRTGRGGIYLAGGAAIDDIVIADNEVFNADGRGIVIWDGAKTDIAITGNDVHDIGNCCGIELQDGTASGVQVTGNTVTNVGDSGMGFVQLGGTHGPNLIANNTLSNTGRFGIEIKIPDGTGVDSDTAPGAIVVRNNTVTGPAAPATGDARDRAGIAVFRRAFCPTCNELDVTRGVVVRDNVVTGWQQPSANDGFGIVVEGTLSRAFANTISTSDVALQLQAGNDGFPLDSDQAATNAYFSRGNAPATCALVGSNAFTGNTVDRRDVAPAGTSVAGVARNATTGEFFCSVQSAIDDADTLAGHAIEVFADQTLAGTIAVTKSLTLRGLGADGSRPALTVASGAVDQPILRVVNVPDVTIENFRLLGDQTFVGPAITTSGAIAGLVVRRNAIVSSQSGAARTGFGERNAIEINRFRDGNNVDGGAGLVTITDNTCDGSLRSATEPVYFRACIWIEAAGGTVSDNELRSGFYDALVRFTTSPTLLSDNEFRGAGVQVTAANLPGPVTLDGNLFDPDETEYAYVDGGGQPIPFGDARLGTVAVMLKLQNPNSTQNPGGPLPTFTPLVVRGNTFTDHVIGIWGQNPADFTLEDNTFTPRAGASDFTHLVIGNKSGSSDSHTIVPAPLAITATGNTFHSLGADVGTHVALWNHAASFAGNASTYGTLSFSGNAFEGAPARYFALDDSSCAESTTLACLPPLATALGYAGYPATPVAPFAGEVLAASNTYAGVAPAAMDVAQFTALQARTFHNDPTAADRPDLAAGVLGVVRYGASPVDVTLTAATLAQVYDGTPRTVAFTTNPANAAASIALRYTGSANDGSSWNATTAPTLASTVGYAVVAEPTSAAWRLLSQSPSPATLVVARATVAITLSDLVQIADGSPRAVTVQTSVADVPFTVTYDGAATAPSAAGSYAVEVTIDEPNHEGSATGTLVIQPAAAGSLAADGATSFAGIAGLALAGAQPSVLVRDVNGAPLAGATVVFELTAGGGSLAGATVLTGADGVATLGGWTLGRDAGSNTIAARLPGSPAIAAVVFTATGAEQSDLGIDKSTNTPTPAQETIVNFTLVVTNAGPSNASQVEVLDALPAGLDAATAQWLCIAGGTGASCGTASSGGGDVVIDDAVLPVGGTLTVLVSATAIAEPGETVTNVAAVTNVGGTDLDTANDTNDASVRIGQPGDAVDPLFMDGFEDAAAVPTAASAKALALAAPAGAARAPSAVAVLVDAAGAVRATLDAMPLGVGTAWRVRSHDAGGAERATAWLGSPAFGPYAGGITLVRDAAGVRVAAPGVGAELLVPDASIERARPVR